MTQMFSREQFETEFYRRPFKNTEQLAIRLGCSPSTVSNRLAEYGLSINARNALHPQVGMSSWRNRYGVKLGKPTDLSEESCRRIYERCRKYDETVWQAVAALLMEQENKNDE